MDVLIVSKIFLLSVAVASGCQLVLSLFFIPHFHSNFQIDELLEYAPILSSGPAFENACKYIDEYLEKRTFFVGYSLSIADIAIWAGLAGKGFLLYIFQFTRNDTRFLLNNLPMQEELTVVVIALCGCFLVVSLLIELGFLFSYLEYTATFSGFTGQLYSVLRQRNSMVTNHFI